MICSLTKCKLVGLNYNCFVWSADKIEPHAPSGPSPSRGFAEGSGHLAASYGRLWGNGLLVARREYLLCHGYQYYGILLLNRGRPKPRGPFHLLT